MPFKTAPPNPELVDTHSQRILGPKACNGHQREPADAEGYRPCFSGGIAVRYDDNPTWQNLVLFHEYFHAETGEGLGASHQTGWTSLVVRLVRERAEKLTDYYQS